MTFAEFDAFVIRRWCKGREVNGIRWELEKLGEQVSDRQILDVVRRYINENSENSRPGVMAEWLRRLGRIFRRF